MPVEKLTLSVDQFAELLGFDPRRFVGVQVMKQTRMIWVLLEPDDERRVPDSTAE